MLERKISLVLEDYLTHDENKILCINGARQIGKTYIIREYSKRYYSNYIEINMANNFLGEKLFENIKTIDDFYIAVSTHNGKYMDKRSNTIIFLDEIQVYPELLTLLKPLNEDNKYKYIVSGSSLGLALHKTTLIPIGSIREVKMYPLDFEEFLLANNVGGNLIDYLKNCFINKESVKKEIHDKVLSLFKTYLYVGGLPNPVNKYLETKNIFKIREAQDEVIDYYKEDIIKYDKEHKLKIQRIYEMIISTIDNKVNRLRINKIDDERYSKYENYNDSFEYLIYSNVVNETNAISEPKIPLSLSMKKNLFKFYYNDVGLLTNFLYRYNLNAILKDENRLNLGSVYETVVAMELKAHNHNLYYYDRKNVGEVDFLLDDYNSLSIIPLEIKSGKDYTSFKALPKLIENENYIIKKGYVLSNDNEIKDINNIIYIPIYMIMFF